MFGKNKRSHRRGSGSYWFLVFVFDFENIDKPQRIGNTVTTDRPFDWLIEHNTKTQQVRLVNFWPIDKARYDALKDTLA
jgi:hypothetical protein